ncbi:MAG: pectinesterase family protein [Paludibacteraceae bacterium]
MHSLLVLITGLVLHVNPGDRISAALDSARTVYVSRGEATTIYLAPGSYEEELTIDIPGLRLINDAPQPSIALRNAGVDIDSAAVRITWYYGHGYQYASMGNSFNYGGKRTRRWNASVLVDAPDFYAEGIIFENSFNQYISAQEAQDSLVDISQAQNDRTANERPKRVMPVRPKEAGSTEVQRKMYIERATAISFTSRATHAVLKNCRCVGHQDVLYGDQGASVYVDGGVLQGGVDFIFGGLMLAVDRATIVVNVSDEKGDKCYISASRNDPDGTHETADKYGNPAPGANPRGMLFYRCHIRFATEDELARPGCTPAYLARPWRWWGETVWAYTTWDEGCVNSEGWHTGLTKGTPCPYSYEYMSQDGSAARPDWVTVLTTPTLPDGTQITPANWRPPKQ